MKYFNLPCPGCGEIMHEGDDIVVCPECATPQHRECWAKKGRCVNYALHDGNFTWTESCNAEDPPIQEEDSDVIICHICSSENPNDALHCGNCGALFGETEEPTEAANSYLDGLNFDRNEPIADYSADDYALYTQLNAKRYVTKFRKIANGKHTFNWGAFLFGPSWFLFRKLYKIGVILLIAFASITMMTASVQTEVYEATEKFSSLAQPILESETITVSDAEIHKIISDYYKEITRPLLVLSAIFLTERLICGFLADKKYFDKINADLKIIGETVEDESVRQIMIARRGSVSFLAFFAANLGEQVLLNLFVMAADAVSEII